MNHLLGFYCDSETVHNIYSKVNEFKDNRYGSFCSIIKPLKFQQSESKWFTVPQNYSSHPVLDYIIANQLLFYTSDDDRDFEHDILGYQCGVMMHVPVDEPIMSRTGVFVVRKGQQWEPLTIKFKRQLYLLECKGVGSGVGGYKDTHFRTQAGTLKSHIRVTGGMVRESVETEIKNLMLFQSYFNFNQSGILPYGCIGFDLNVNDSQSAIELGLLLRLAPSNIRLSYREFGDFEYDLDFSQIVQNLSAFNEQLYTSGFRHENLNINNLCYLYPNQHVVTDFEELRSIYSVPSSLDVIPSNEPLYFKVYPFRYSFNDDYTASPPVTFMDEVKYQETIDSSFESSHAILNDHFYSSVRFLTDDYFNLTLMDWLDETLKPLLNYQSNLLFQYLEHVESNPTVMLKDFISSSPEFKNRQEKRSLKDYFSLYNIESIFLRPEHSSISFIKKRIKHIQLLNRQIDSTLSKGFVYRVPSSYRFSFIKSELMVDFYDCYLLMFPFLQWVTHWVSFLELNYSQNSKVQTLIQRLENDLNDTETIYSKFKENSADRFITYLTQY